MLSGIGDPDHLRDRGIAPRVILPGVGQNLQDRYEVGVVNRMSFDAWKVLRGATFKRGDRQYGRLEPQTGWGLHDQRVAALRRAAIRCRSPVAGPVPLCAAGEVPGYEPGYSKAFAEFPNYLTWVVLKGHTNNTAGSVRLRSSESARSAARQLQVLRGRQRRQRSRT
jgi:choline dehydrogenase-like flavoprotein